MQPPEYYQGDTKGSEEILPSGKEVPVAKNWFRFTIQEDTPSPNGLARTAGPADSTVVVSATQELTVAEARPPARLPAPVPGESSPYASFEQIYQNAAVKPPRLPYGILKVASMASSSHLAGLSADAKRCSLLMALEAAGVEVEDLLQDAVVRQKALNDYEDGQHQKLKEFEAAKLEENSKIQAEMDRLTSQFLSRIQANLEEVAHEQDKFRAWQRGKQQEAQRITEAATFCVPQGSASSGLAEVLERATLARR
jgi:hypothetical protein